MRRHTIAVPAVWLLATITIGCRPNETQDGARPDAPVPRAGAADHQHGAGPHGGTIAEWGKEEFHVEFTVDHDRRQATVYVLGRDAKTPAPVSTEVLLLSIREPRFQLELAANPLDEEPQGTASRFVGRHDDLGKVQEFAGTISAEVGGKPYAGDFQEEAHAHE